jgi:hypothetical protein
MVAIKGMRSGKKTLFGMKGFDQGRTCKRCGDRFRRKRFECGRLESTTSFRKRRYCSTTCAEIALAERWQAQAIERQRKQAAADCKAIERGIEPFDIRWNQHRRVCPCCELTIPLPIPKHF